MTDKSEMAEMKKLSEMLRDKAFECDEEMLAMAADKAEQLEIQIEEFVSDWKYNFEQLVSENEALKYGLSEIRYYACGHSGDAMRKHCLAVIAKLSDTLLTGKQQTANRIGAWMMSEHVHEWEYGYDVGFVGIAVEGIFAECECGEKMGYWDMEVRLNATERLSAENARNCLVKLRGTVQKTSAEALRAYVDIREGK